MNAISFDLKGIEELERKLGPGLVAGPISRFLRRSGFKVMTKAQQNTRPNVFDGALWNQFAVDVDQSTIAKKVTISNNAEYAPYLEYGTRPHFPPIAAITPWAEAHGWIPFILARHISQHGTKAHPFMEPALKDSIPAIKGYLELAKNEIEAGARG